MDTLCYFISHNTAVFVVLNVLELVAGILLLVPSNCSCFVGILNNGCKDSLKRIE